MTRVHTHTQGDYNINRIFGGLSLAESLVSVAHSRERDSSL